MNLRGSQALAVLRKRDEFLAAARNGRKWVAPGLILQALAACRDETRSSIRYGLTASGKVGPAVTRNRARRRLRALAIEVLPPHAAPGHDYVLIARATTIARDFADLREDLVTALRKLGCGMNKPLLQAERVAGLLLCGLIQLYRYSFATLCGGRCRFTPSCSAYAIEAITVHGPVRGTGLAVGRICRCHPWGKHGFNPVPPRVK